MSEGRYVDANNYVQSYLNFQTLFVKMLEIYQSGEPISDNELIAGLLQKQFLKRGSPSQCIKDTNQQSEQSQGMIKGDKKTEMSNSFQPAAAHSAVAPSTSSAPQEPYCGTIPAKNGTSEIP